MPPLPTACRWSPAKNLRCGNGKFRSSHAGIAIPLKNTKDRDHVGKRYTSERPTRNECEAERYFHDGFQ